MPKQGARAPWQVHQSYLRDYRSLKLGDIEDGTLEISDPTSATPSRRAVGARNRRKEPTMQDVKGKVAAITGAGSGIGRALAVELARRGAHLAVSDVDAAGLAETVTLCEGRGVKVTSTIVDVADRAAVFAWADQVVDEHGTVNLIFNNAGVALIADVDGHELRRPRVADGHQPLGRGARHQGVPAPPRGVGRRPHRQRLEHLRAVQRAVAVGLQRGQVRRAGLHRRPAHGARDQRLVRLVHHRPPGRHQDQHRPQRPRRPRRTRRRPTSAATSRRSR